MKLAILGLLLTANASAAPLYIGDSHSVMTFGTTLTELLPGTQRYAVAGSAANDWLKPLICPKTADCPFVYGYATPAGAVTGSGTVPETFPGLAPILENLNPATVIVALGTNDASQRCRMPKREAMKPFADFIQTLGDRSCIWIGPPSYKKGPVARDCKGLYDAFVDNLEKTVEANGCQFLDSRRVIDDQTGRPIEADLGDEVHFGERIGKLWARAIAQKVQPLLQRSGSSEKKARKHR